MLMFLCVSDSACKTAGIFKKTDAGLELVFCTPDLAKKLLVILKNLKDSGVSVRVERFVSKQINVDREKIGADDPRYLAGCAEEFSALGFKTFIYPTEKAEIFQKLFELSVPTDLRGSFIHSLNLLNKNAAQELEDILNQAMARASGK